MNTELNVTEHFATMANSTNYDKPGMATLKALSIMLMPLHAQLLQRNNENSNHFKLPYGKHEGRNLPTIDLVENTQDDVVTIAIDEEQKPVLSKNQGMIYHLKHTKNNLQLN